jgi:predicted 2-oxoglutarate/Fe(II)-dependent dioxygenase YbiX
MLKMSNGDFIRKFGLFVEPEFLDSTTCSRVVAEARAAAAEKGIVVGGREVRGMGGAVDESVRKVWNVQVGGATESEISYKLEGLRPTLEQHFNIRFSAREGPYFLRYDEGGFHVPHRDSRSSSPVEVRKREVSVIIFLNPSVDDRAIGDGYGGGELFLYGLFDDPKLKNFGFSVEATPGLLLAYRSQQAHGVSPVKFGQRFTIVAWFLQNPD